MAQQVISIGSKPADSLGDPLRVSFDKVNQNFTELYSLASPTSSTVGFSPVPSTSVGSDGDTVGLTAIDQNFLYYCTAQYDGITQIWQRSPLSGAVW